MPANSTILLPSQDTALEFATGTFPALHIARDVAGRAVIIAAGVWLAGERSPGRLVKCALAGSAAIEAFVLAWSWWHRADREPDRPTGSVHLIAPSLLEAM